VRELPAPLMQEGGEGDHLSSVLDGSLIVEPFDAQVSGERRALRSEARRLL